LLLNFNESSSSAEDKVMIAQDFTAGIAALLSFFLLNLTFPEKI
jgi:hypothetical protein